jgi:NADH-quinone oxidoreductase subunit E
MANWEFFDNQTPESTKQLVDDLREGKPVAPTRGPSRVCTFKEVSRVLAGFHDGLADEGVGAGPASLQGLNVAREHGWTAPGSAADVSSAQQAEADSGAMARGRHSSEDTPANEPDELPGGKDADAAESGK